MTIQFEGKKLELMQNAYVDGTSENVHYTARAVDSEGNEYKVTWEITHPDFAMLGDESDACNWDEYEVTKI
jgi:hypothetical protein